MIETNDCICVRQVFDKACNQKTDVQTVALALVLHDFYVSPSLDRGARGSAGSDDGVRTIVEDLHLEIRNHYNAELDNLDLNMRVHTPSAGRGEGLSAIPDTRDLLGKHSLAPGGTSAVPGLSTAAGLFSPANSETGERRRLSSDWSNEEYDDRVATRPRFGSEDTVQSSKPGIHQSMDIPGSAAAAGGGAGTRRRRSSSKQGSGKEAPHRVDMRAALQPLTSKFHRASPAARAYLHDYLAAIPLAGLVPYASPVGHSLQSHGSIASPVPASVEVPEPTSLYGLQDMQRLGKAFTGESCNVVTSFEDVLFISNVVLPLLLSGGKRRDGHGSRHAMAHVPVDAVGAGVTNDMVGGAKAGTGVDAAAASATEKRAYFIAKIDVAQIILVDHILGLHHPLLRLMLTKTESSGLLSFKDSVAAGGEMLPSEPGMDVRMTDVGKSAAKEHPGTLPRDGADVGLQTRHLAGRLLLLREQALYAGVLLQQRESIPKADAPRVYGAWSSGDGVGERRWSGKSYHGIVTSTNHHHHSFSFQQHPALRLLQLLHFYKEFERW